VDDPYQLARFVSAQQGTYDQAVAELRRGRKTGHWIWYVFPQLAGLGMSPTSQRYAIGSLDEARAYLEHPVLGPRLIQAASVLLGNTESTAEQLLGELDAMKVRSSMTLFQRAQPDEPVFGRVLDRFFEGIPDAETLRRL
jgi:uncharacterized protein (DUF1810 family)